MDDVIVHATARSESTSVDLVRFYLEKDVAQYNFRFFYSFDYINNTTGDNGNGEPQEGCKLHCTTHRLFWEDAEMVDSPQQQRRPNLASFLSLFNPSSHNDPEEEADVERGLSRAPGGQFPAEAPAGQSAAFEEFKGGRVDFEPWDGDMTLLRSKRHKSVHRISIQKAVLQRGCEVFGHATRPSHLLLYTEAYCVRLFYFGCLPNREVEAAFGGIREWSHADLEVPVRE
eukprot:GHVU01148618.1.p1 GENE.GHVU01148618.1~~GHVU01148618.1.p1  ORF type:complete len:229 (+),score=39.36 GHVU01148618.1:363-1049(+)